MPDDDHLHHYYVTYSANSPYGQATGSVDLHRTFPVRSMEDVQEIRQCIVEAQPQNRLSSVVVLGWQRFETEG